MKKISKKRALFSLYDLDRAAFFAKELISLGWELVATKETADLLARKGIKAVTIYDFLGVKDKYAFPPTLHPEIESALTGDSKRRRIDLVYDTAYPLSKGIDVGGHTLLALAAKGQRIPVSDKDDMVKVIARLKNNNNEIDPSFRRRLIDKAFMNISAYYSSIVNKFDAAPHSIISLLNGENPYQVPADLFHTDESDPLAIGNFKRLSGTAPCYTNIADFDSILKILCSASGAFKGRYKKTPYIAIAAKHGNPCGLSADWDSPSMALDGALWGNPLAVWGGEVITNFSISKREAKQLNSSSRRNRLLGASKWMLDLVAAPDFSKEAISILADSARRKIFKNEALRLAESSPSRWAERMVRGGFLRQPPNDYILDFNSCAADFAFPGNKQIDSLIIAWACAWFSSHGGNEVAIARDRSLIGAGGGPSTIDACRAAIMRAKGSRRDMRNSAFAANAFFPFVDAPRALIKAGCAYGLVPSGGVKEESVKKCFKTNGVKVFYLPEKYRGFSRH